MLKPIFIFTTFIHVLINFMGFAKAFGYGNITQLTQEISQQSDILGHITGVFLSLVLFYRRFYLCHFYFKEY